MRIADDTKYAPAFSLDLKEGLEEPITPPIGIPVTQEEYEKIMRERIEIMRERIGEGAQFVP